MSTRFSKTKEDPNMLNQGYEGTNVPQDFSIPPCSIEDVDRALFDLFNEEIPFFFELEKETRRIPVIFATGERFAILRRRRPLRDRSGALILPLISIMRTSINQDVARGTGPGQTQPLVIKKRLDKEDHLYQRLVNKAGLINQDDVAAEDHFSDKPFNRQALAGKVASKSSEGALSLEVSQGKLLTTQLNSKNIYEIITIPPVKYFMATYEVTFWTQYTQKMNDMLIAMMSAYQNMHKRTFRVETKKGYWFVAYVGESLSSESNFSDFSDSERIIKYTFPIEIPAYIVNPSFPGSPNALRAFTSAVDIQFDTYHVSNKMIMHETGGPPSGNPNDFILDDLSNVGDKIPGSKLLGKGGTAAVDSGDVSGNNAIAGEKTVSLGGAQSGIPPITAPAIEENPFTGEKLAVPLDSYITTMKGESTYKDLSTGELLPWHYELEMLNMDGDM